VFDVVDEEADFSNYKLIVLPDVITLEGKLLQKFKAFLASGGKLILTGASGMNPERTAFAFDFRASVSGRSVYQRDYLVAKPGLDARLPESPFILYDRAYCVKSTGAEVLAETRVPYFNRTWDHFCGHQHAPFRRGPNLEYDGILLDGNIAYFSHPICEGYFNMGQPLLKYAFIGALNRLLPEREVAVQMPSSGRISYMEQKAKNRRLLHVLYAQTQLRGTAIPFLGSIQNIEILEDAVPLPAAPCSIRLASKPARIFRAASGKDVPFTWQNGRADFTLTDIHIHEAAVIEL
jgi:hypothetical protein